MMSRTSGGGLPEYLIASRPKSLRLREQLLQCLSDKDQLIPDWLCRDTSKHAHPNSKESKPSHLIIEVVDSLKYNWIRLKCKIENTQKECIP